MELLVCKILIKRDGTVYKVEAFLHKKLGLEQKAASSQINWMQSWLIDFLVTRKGL